MSQGAYSRKVLGDEELIEKMKRKEVDLPIVTGRAVLVRARRAAGPLLDRSPDGSCWESADPAGEH